MHYSEFRLVSLDLNLLQPRTSELLSVKIDLKRSLLLLVGVETFFGPSFENY